MESEAQPTYEPTGNEWMLGSQIEHPESGDSLKLRMQLNQAYPAVSIFAKRLGITTFVTSYPAPAIGGPVVTVDLLNCVIDQNVMGRTSVTRFQVADAMEHCIGTVEHLKKRLFWKQAVNPVYYLVLVAAFIIRIPFMILEKAGLPREVESTVWGHVVKVFLFFLLVFVCARYGLKLSSADLLALFK